MLVDSKPCMGSVWWHQTITLADHLSSQDQRAVLPTQHSYLVRLLDFVPYRYSITSCSIGVFTAGYQTSSVVTRVAVDQNDSIVLSDTVVCTHGTRRS